MVLYSLTGCSPQTESPENNAVTDPDITLTQQNRPPVITTDPVTEALPGTPYIYQTSADDPDGDEFSWELLESPAGIAMDARSGLLYGEITSPGEHLVRILVTDERGAKTEQNFTVVVVPRPVITSIPPLYAFNNAIFQYQLHAYDSDHLSLNYTMTGGPTGMEFGRDSGLLNWAEPEPGVFDIELTVTNNLGYSTSQAFSLEILQEQELVIVSRPETQAYVSKRYEYQIAILALQESGPSFRLVQSPHGMTMDETVGRISWEPQSEGLHHVEILVTNEAGHQDTQRFDIEVIALETMDLIFNSLIGSLFDTVSLGNFQEVSRLLTPQAAIWLIPVLRTLQPFVTGMKDNFDPAARLMINGDIAEYIISGTQFGRQQSYIVTFIRNSSGDWEIHSM